MRLILLTLKMSQRQRVATTTLTLLVVMCVPADSTASSLRFVSQSPDRPLAYYRAPSPYQEPGKTPLNSVIITSKPFNIATTTTTSTTTPPPLWRRKLLLSSSLTTERTPTTLNIPQYNIDCINGKQCSETITILPATQNPTFKPYPQDVIDKFLRDFANVNSSPKSFFESDVTSDKYKENDNKLGASSDQATNRLANLFLDDSDESNKSVEPELSEEKSSKSANWHLIQAQQHNHPYDDRDGWVSLEPVPWSTSKVSKWHASSSNKRPSYPNFQSVKPPNKWDTRPQNDWSSDSPPRPSWDKPQYDRPSWDKPQYDTNYEKPKPSYWSSDPKPPSHWDRPNGFDYSKPHWTSQGQSDIVTDGKPGKWPEQHAGGYRPLSSSPGDRFDDFYSNHGDRRPEVVYATGNKHPSGYPEESEGEWVLLSSTKGYSLPHRHKIFQRALTFSAQPLTSKRTVRLTVLPALNGTTNTTISHGGLLEVESTFQTVDEAHQQHLADVPVVQPKNVTAAVRVLHSAPALNSRAVLAAVGAGMVPATMAVLVPMFLGRKKRSSDITKEMLMKPTTNIYKKTLTLENRRNRRKSLRNKQVK